MDLRSEWTQGRRGLLSPPLVAAIHTHLRAGGGIALFVGRTGYARILRCSECGFTVRCPRCEVTMLVRLSPASSAVSRRPERRYGSYAAHRRSSIDTVSPGTREP